VLRRVPSTLLEQALPGKKRIKGSSVIYLRQSRRLEKP